MAMNSVEKRIDQIFIMVDGANLAKQWMELLDYAEVESSLYLPSMCTLRFADDELALIDSTVFQLGAKIEILMAPWQDTQAKTVFQGEVTAVEPDFPEDTLALLVVRAYDVRHRLTVRHTRTFLNMTDGDIVKRITGEAGIALGKMGSTSTVREHIFQDNQTDLAFIQMLALRNGFQIAVNGEKLDFCKPSPSTTLDLKWRENLRSFRPRVTVSQQVGKVQVRAWDPKTKKAFVEQSTTQTYLPKVAVANERSKPGVYTQATYAEGRIPKITQSEVKSLAASLSQEIGAAFAEAEGTAVGNGALMPGVSVKIGNIGNRFGGTYVLTSTRHTYSLSGYDTHFTVEGLRPQQVSDLVAGSRGQSSRWQGVMVGIVTDNNDPDKLGRVKVKFPTLTEDYISQWAPLVTIGAGANRGIQWLPEVNDEVLVAFEFGDINSPFVIGGVWNGKDKPPEAQAVANGNTKLRTMKSRTGHYIRMTDDEKGSLNGIEIGDGTSKYTVVINAKTGEIVITSSGKITVNAKTDLALTGMKVTMEGQTVSITGKTVSVKADGTLQLEASGATTLKGSVVNIN